MSACIRIGRPGIQALHSLVGTVGLALLVSCAPPLHQRSAGLFAPDPPMPPPVLDTLQVHELRGSATVQRGVQRVALQPETEVHENQPVQVGPRSTLRLALGQRALLDLGPSSRVVLHKLPRDGKGEERATWLRLEQGYLRVVWSDERGDTPMEVSFGRWAARIGAGEHFFDTRGTSASACSTSGSMTLSGVPEWTPKSLSEPCVTLEPHHAPVEIALREKDWDTLRTRRRLQPTLARAAEKQAAQAVAQLDREGIRRVAWKPATSPGAFSADRLVPNAPMTAPRLFSHTPPVIEMPVAPPPATVVAPPRDQGIAFAPPSPATVVTPPEPVDVIAPEDVPVVSAAESVPPPVAAATTSEPFPAQAVLDAAPTAAGPTETDSIPDVTTAAPALKWTEDLQTEPSNLQPADAAPALPQTPTAAAATQPVEQVSAYGAPQGTAVLPQAITPAPAVEAPDASVAGERAEWIVNVATYAAPELAQQHAQQLIAQNFRATVRDETVRGRSSYRVVIEGLPTEAAAQSAVADLGTRWGVRSAWAMRKR